MTRRYPINEILDYENGELDEEDTISLFQQFIDNGMVWGLQGSYGRMAEKLIAGGYCTDKGE